MKINDIDLNDWKNNDVNVNSLWLINERDKSGKHTNIYHGNFIPQIPYQLIKRFTRENELVFEPFMGSGTTLFECENLNRKYIGIDINPEMIKYVNQAMSESLIYKNSEVLPLGFYCMDMIKRSFKVKLKGIIVKNIEGNRGKLGQEGIWRYRALKSDYFMEYKYA